MSFRALLGLVIFAVVLYLGALFTTVTDAVSAANDVSLGGDASGVVEEIVENEKEPQAIPPQERESLARVGEAPWDEGVWVRASGVPLKKIAEDLRWGYQKRAYTEYKDFAVALPYPTGWYVYRDEGWNGETVLSVYDFVRVPNSDHPPQYTLTRSQGAVQDVYSENDNVDRLEVRRSGKDMHRLRGAFGDDFYGPNASWVSYVWVQDGYRYELFGLDGHPVLEAAAMTMRFVDAPNTDRESSQSSPAPIRR